MMDFDSHDRGQFDDENTGLQDSGSGGAPVSRSLPGGAQIILPDANGVVILPAGASLEDVRAEGRDLVIELSDGSRFIIPDGAIVVPQLVVDGVAIPPLNLAALLVDSEPEPAAGATQSSGNNFAVDPADIQAAYALGDLLPYTELRFPEPEEEEIIPNLADEDPEVIIITPDNPVGVINAIASVDESGLPARGDGEVQEPAGTASETDVETTTGTISINAPDGLQSVSLNGVPITAVGQTFVTELGTLTITSINLATGQIGFSYTLGDNTLGAESDPFEVTVVDSDGDVATATLNIEIIDDAPIVVADVDTIPAGTYGPATGNVITGEGTAGNTADEVGADGAVLTAIANSEGEAGTQGEGGAFVVVGLYGTLTIFPDGSYSYTRDPGTPGGVQDVFTYTLTDGDGSTASTTLTIDIGDSPATVISVPETGAGTVVDEGGLPPREDGPVGSGEGADGNPDNDSDESEATTGTINFTAPDGVAQVTINGVVITGPGQEIITPEGTLTIVSFDPDAGTLEYTFTLADDTDGDDTSVTFTIEVTDTDGDSDSAEFTIDIIDDVPLAVDDSATQVSENAPITVDAFANDTPGADGVDFDDIAIVPDSLTGEGQIVYNGDGTFTYIPAPGEEGDENGQITFEYTITDGDGDTSTATVTITLLPDSTPEVGLAGDNTVDEAGLPAREGEPAGSDAASDSEIASGTITPTTGNDTLASLVINGVDVTEGGTVTTDKGTLVVVANPDGTYGYTYTLDDNTLSDPDSDSFTIVVTDSDGDTANATLVIAIADDTPAAEDDANSVPAGTYGPVEGSVTANDTPGADGIEVVSFSGAGGSGGPGTVVQGQYGTLTINADGSYTYTRDPGTPGGVTDTFNYVIEDGDGDQANADLIITIADSPPTLVVPEPDPERNPELSDPGTVVDEAGLAGPPEGSDAAGDGELTSGTINFSAPDGPAVVTIGGVTITGPGQTITGAFGTLTITEVTNGSISYTYELTTNTSGDNTSDIFAVTVTDQDGDVASSDLEIIIIDDVPTAVADFDEVIENEGGLADGNVLTGTGGTDANDLDGVADTQGADGAVVQTTGTFTGTYGTLTLLEDGTYEYILTQEGEAALELLTEGETLEDVFPYTIVDGDGDTSDTTLTITLRGADDPVTLNGVELGTPLVIVDEANLPDGTSPNDLQLTQLGNFSFDAPDGLDDVTIGGVTVVQDGAFVPGQTIDTPAGLITVTGFVPTTSLDGTVTGGTILFEYLLQDNTLLHDEPGTDLSSEFLDVVVTDEDGDSDSGVLQIDIIDDVPSINEIFVEGGITLDETNAGTPSGFPITADSGGPIIFIDLAEGADGVVAPVFTIDVVGDGSTALQTAIGDFPISLVQTSETVITGVYDDGTGQQTAFTVTINADGSTTLTQNVPLEHIEDGDDSAGEHDDLLTLDGLIEAKVTVTDGDGDQNSATIGIGNSFGFLDDGPTATDNSNTVTEGASTGGNVLTEDDGFGVDASGADGYGETGAIIQITSVNDTITQTTVNAAGELVIETTLGTLTVNVTTGVYTYSSKTNSTNADADDVFTYTIVDADGDTSTATLTISVDNVGGTVTNNGVLVNEAGLPIGSDPTSDSEIDADGQVTVTGATGTLVYSLTGGTFNAVDNTWTIDGTYGTIVLDAATGEYTYTLDTPFTDGDAVENTTNLVTGAETFEVVVEDTIGNEIGRTDVVVDILDDVPTATDQALITVAEDAVGTIGGNVVTDGTPDTEGADGATVTSFTVGGITTEVPQDGTLATYSNANGTYTMDMDGNWTFDPNPGLDNNGANIDAGFTYTLTDGDDDFDTAEQPIEITDGAPPLAGQPISLLLDDENLVDTDGNFIGPDVDSDTIVFTAGSDPIDTITFSTDLTGLDPALTWTRSADGQTIEGRDGTDLIVTLALTRVDDSVTVTATLSDNFADHPVIGTGLPGDDTFDLGDIGVVAEDTDGDTATTIVSVSVSDDVPDAVDDPAATVAEDAVGTIGGNLLANDDGGADVTAEVTHVNIDGAGFVAIDTGVDLGGGVYQFTGANGVYTIDAAGNWTFDPAPGLDHTGGDIDASFSYRLTDADGDFDDASQPITVTDGAPPLAGTPVSLLLDDENLVDADDNFVGPDTDSATITFTAGSDPIATIAFGTDLTGLDPALTWTRSADGQTIEGRDGTDLIVTLSLTRVDDTVTVTATLSDNFDSHPLAGDDNPAFDLGDVQVVATDIDGDFASTTVSVAVSDDVPTVTETGNEATLSVDETGIGITPVSDTQSFAGAFDISYGADGELSTVYSLGITSTASGLVDSRTNTDVTLALESGEVVGRNGNGQEVFRISVDGDGNVTFTQSRAVKHGDPLQDNEPISLLDSLVTLTATATDGDNDVASAMIDIGANITILDDAPISITFNPTGTGVEVDETNGFGIPTDSTGAVVSASIAPGNDGLGSFAFALDLVGDGTTSIVTSQGGFAVTLVHDEVNSPNLITGVYNDGVSDQVAFTVTINPLTGVLTLTQNVALDHPTDGPAGPAHDDTIDLAGLVNAVINVTDNDGDPLSASTAIGDKIVFRDDGPTANDDTNSLTEDTASVGGNILTDGTADSYGNDGAGSITTISGAGGPGTVGGTTTGAFGTLTLGPDGTYTYVLNQAAVQGLGVGESETDTFTYTIIDADGDTDTATLTITIEGQNDAPTVGTAAVAVSDEGIDDPNPDTAGDPTDTTDATSVTGNVAINDVDTNDTVTVTLGIPTATLNSGGQTITWALSADGKTLTGSTAANGIVLSVEIDDNGDFQVDQFHQIDHPLVGVEDVLDFVVPVFADDGNTTPLPQGSITVSLEDDSPTLGDLGDISVSNEPGDPVTVNDLLFSAGGDGFGDVTITADVSGLTSGGIGLATTQLGNVLVAFADANNDGVFDPGEATVFTITVDPDAGTSGTYTFDLVQAIDPEVTQVNIGNGSSFGAGPSDSIIVTESGLDLVYVTGWLPTGGFTPAEEAAWFAGGNPALIQEPDVNGSTSGWGLFNNNFNDGEFLRFDFGGLDDYDGPGGYSPPGGTNIESASYATFSIFNPQAGDIVKFVAHFSDGTTQSYTLDGAVADTLRIDAPPGTTIAWIDAYQSSGDTKLNLDNVGVTNTTLDETFTVNITLTDSDDDPVSDSFDITISDDAPDAQDDLATTVVIEDDINAAFVLDFSGSVDNQELNLQLDAVKDAAFEIFNTTSGAVTIKLVIFSSTSLDFGPFTSFADFANQLDALNTELGGLRQLSNATDFTDGIQTLIGTYTPIPGAKNEVFFLSDGNPNEQTGTGGNSLNDAVAAQWQTFINDNDLNVTAIGIGNGVNDARLQDVDLDGDNTVLRADDFDDIVSSLVTAITPPVTGNVLDNDTPASNGIQITSITVGDVRYDWDGGTTITLSTGGTLTGTAISVVTPDGADFDFDFATGDWTYDAADDTAGGIETFPYVVTDADGDVDSAVIAIDIAGITGGSNFAQNDVVITNAGTSVVIPKAALTQNDTAGATITGVAEVNGGSGLTDGGTTLTFTDTGDVGGSFVYEATLGSATDPAFVTINRAQAGQSQLDGTSGDDILIGRDGANDTLIGNDGADVMFGGTGSDSFFVGDGNSAPVVGGSGDNGTISGFDTILDFSLAADNLNFPGTPVPAANTVGGINGNNSTLTINGSTVKSHAISNGIITFDDDNAYSSALSLTSESDLAAVVQYLQANDIGATNTTVAFVVGSDTYIYHQTSGGPSAANDSLVKLEGIVVPNLNSLFGSTVTPVVLDVAGKGFGFASLDDGIAYDYDNDGVKTQTAWVLAGSAILVYDADNNKTVTDASEFVFGTDGMTDLEAIAANFDDNGDGVLDSNDSAFAQFGIWQDHDGDAVADPGEYTSLEDAGIASIGLVSDGVVSSAAGGDVTIYGEASFTWTDGTTGLLADAAFSTGADVDGAAMDALLIAASSQSAQDLPDEKMALEDIGGKGTQDLDPIRVALDDVDAGTQVDAIIDGLLGDAPLAALDAGPSLIIDNLDGFGIHGVTAFALSDFPTIQDDAAVLASSQAA